MISSLMAEIFNFLSYKRKKKAEKEVKSKGSFKIFDLEP